MYKESESTVGSQSRKVNHSALFVFLLLGRESRPNRNMTFHFLIVPKGFPTLDLFREGKFYPFWGLHKWGGGGSYNCLHWGERLSWIFLNILENPGRSRKEGHDKLKLSSNWSIFACLWSTLDKVKQSQLRKKSPHCQSIGRTIWFIISRLDNQVFGEELGLISGTCSSRVSKEQLYGKRIYLTLKYVGHLFYGFSEQILAKCTNINPFYVWEGKLYFINMQIQRTFMSICMQ